jgi:hypothetical protein
MPGHRGMLHDEATILIYRKALADFFVPFDANRITTLGGPFLRHTAPALLGSRNAQCNSIKW